ncbi:MAG: hypothetical protein HND51_20375 [Chloroflexi bacterium]|nr:hypothetical protein [Chloroflexota bacterium]
METPFSLDPLLKRYGSRRARLEPVYEDMFEESQALATPRYLQKTFPAGELPVMSADLPGAETITLGLCTLGPALESRVSELFQEEPVSAVVLDEIGTHWVLKLGDKMYRDIRSAARTTGKQTSPSYRPGIGRWPLELQGELLTHLTASKIGVRLIGDMLEPQKSISMIVAVGAKLRRKHRRPAAVGKSTQ